MRLFETWIAALVVNLAITSKLLLDESFGHKPNCQQEQRK